MQNQHDFLKRSRFKIRKVFLKLGFRYQKDTESLIVCLKRQKKEVKGYSIGQFSLINNKIIATNFVNSLGVKTPLLYQAFTRLHDVVFEAKRVLKPSHEAWSRGVFLLNSESVIIDLTDNEKLQSINEIKSKAKRYLDQKIIQNDAWNVEELIVGENEIIPPNDVKFFCFYGKIALIIERIFDLEKQVLIRNHYDGHGNPISPEFLGKKNKGHRNFNDAYFKTAKHISLQIPIPFIRIDLLKSNNGPVFGEFELIPGTLHWLKSSFDKKLGRYYLEAKQRLTKDINEGKKFVTEDELLMFLIKFNISTEETLL